MYDRNTTFYGLSEGTDLDIWLKVIYNRVYKAHEDSKKEENNISYDYRGKLNWIDFFVYDLKLRSVKKNLTRYSRMIRDVEYIGNFKPKKFTINQEAQKVIDKFYPLLEPEDKEVIQSIFHEGMIALRSDDQKHFKKIESKSNLRKFDKLLTVEEKVWFLTILNNQKIKIYDPEYSGCIQFNETPDEDEKYIRYGDNRNLDIIKTLMEANRLKNRYIKKNLSKIKKAYIALGKLTFVNQKIAVLLHQDSSYAEIDYKKLKSVLKSIKNKNEKRIAKLLKSLKRFPEKELNAEHNKYTQELKEQQELKKCERLIYCLVKAKRNGNKELIADYLHQIFEMKIDPEKKQLMEIKAEKRLNQEESERLNEIAERERKLREISEDKRELVELREEAIKRLSTDISLDSTAETITDDGRMKPLVIDKEAREKIINEEISDIQSENQNRKTR